MRNRPPIGREIVFDADPKRAHEVLNKVVELNQTVQESYLQLAALLYEVRERRYYRQLGHETFEAYLENGPGLKIRKGQYLASIQEKLVAIAKIPKEDLKCIGWRKAGAIASLPQEYFRNGKAKEWVEKAKTTVVLVLDAEIKRVKDEALGKKIDSEGPIGKKTFYLFPPQLKNVENALEISKRLSGSDKSGHNLDMICLEFNASHLEEEADRINFILDSVRRVYGVECIAVKIKGKEEVIVYGQAYAKQFSIE